MSTILAEINMIGADIKVPRTIEEATLHEGRMKNTDLKCMLLGCNHTNKQTIIKQTNSNTSTNNFHSEIVLTGKDEDGGCRWKGAVEKAERSNVISCRVFVGAWEYGVDYPVG